MGGSTAAAATQSEVRRRPRDRRLQILLHASELFTSTGFHAVRMEDIAEASGITARALYRHFENKQDLLSHVIIEDQDRLLAALEDPSGGRASVLDDLLHRIIEASLDSLRLGPLWQREARHLGDADFARVRTGTRRIGSTVSEAIRAADTAMPRFRAEVRAWAALSIVTSPGHYDLTLPRRRLAGLLLAASGAAIGAPGPAEPVDSSPRPSRDRLLSSRRELLLAAAARAFRERGYGGVRLDEFGIAGPAVYRYFEGKPDILATLIARLQDWITLEDSRALRRAVEDADVVVELVRGYIRVALDATDLLAVSVTEALYVSDGAADRERRVRTDHMAEWVRWLRVARPELPDPAAQALVHATRTMINDVVRVPRLVHDPALRSELESCALAVLLATELPWSPRTRKEPR